VCMDALLAEQSRAHPLFATDLQVLTMASKGIMSMVASLVKGVLMATYGVRLLFDVGMVVAFTVVPVAVMGWLQEQRAVDSACTLDKALRRDHPGSPIFKLALVVSGLALVLALVAVSSSLAWLGPTLGLFAAVFVGAACWHYEHEISAPLAKVSIYLFLQNALQPHLVVMFKWFRATPANCDPNREVPLPCFSPAFVGQLDVLAGGAFILALALYNSGLSSWSYRSIFYGAQTALVVVNLLDFIWVERWNLVIGVPDVFFALGAELLQPLVDRLSLIPMFVLVVKLCPRESQATAFALNMGLLHLGRNVGSYLGMGLLAMLGGVEPPEFENIQLLIFLRSCTRMLPLLFVRALVPSGSPKEDNAELLEEDEAKGGGGGAENGSVVSRASTRRGDLSRIEQMKKALEDVGVWI